MRRLDRRTFLKGLGATVPVFFGGQLLEACGGGGGSAAPSGSGGKLTVSQLVVAGGGGALTDAYRQAYYQPFTAKTGVKILETAVDPAKLKSMVSSGDVEWDVAQIDAAAAASAAYDGLLERLDYRIINKDGLIPQMVHDAYLINDLAAYVIAWNTKKYQGEDAPQTWADFFNVHRFPGTRGLLNTPGQTLEVVLLGAGVDPKHLYPLDVERALKFLDPIKSQLRFWSTGAQSAQWLIDDEVDLGTSWNGRLQAPKAQGSPVDFTFNQSLLVADAWIVPKGAKHKDASMQFIAFCMQARNQAREAELIPYGPTNTKAFSYLDPQVKALLPNAPGHHYALIQDFDWWARNQDRVTQTWNDWLSS